MLQEAILNILQLIGYLCLMVLVFAGVDNLADQDRMGFAVLLLFGAALTEMKFEEPPNKKGEL
jgi:hypothetical protein